MLKKGIYGCFWLPCPKFLRFLGPVVLHVDEKGYLCRTIFMSEYKNGVLMKETELLERSKHFYKPYRTKGKMYSSLSKALFFDLM